MMNCNCNCNPTKTQKSKQQLLDEIYTIQRHILENSKKGQVSVIVRDSVMSYVPDADFPVPICDNVRSSIVHYSRKNDVEKEFFNEFGHFVHTETLVTPFHDKDRPGEEVLKFTDVYKSLEDGEEKRTFNTFVYSKNIRSIFNKIDEFNFSVELKCDETHDIEVLEAQIRDLTERVEALEHKEDESEDESED